jgi:hypothetical protein
MNQVARDFLQNIFAVGHAHDNDLNCAHRINQRFKSFGADDLVVRELTLNFVQ